MSRVLMVVGVAIFLIGVAWPWVSRLPVGRLPGDIVVRRSGMIFVFPLTTCLIISVVLTVIVWMWRR